jgi:hypothetical protein
MKSATILTILLASICLIAEPAVAFEDGPDSLNLGKATIVKNGAGSRQKMFLSLYDCTLYLNQKSKDAKAIVAADQTMAVRIEVTSRFVSQAKLVSALKDGFNASTGGNTKAIAAKINTFEACFSEPIKMNDVFILAHVPGIGVVVYKNNNQKGVIAGLDFKKALFGIWVGDTPVDGDLKKALLGK